MIARDISCLSFKKRFDISKKKKKKIKIKREKNPEDRQDTYNFIYLTRDDNKFRNVDPQDGHFAFFLTHLN